MTLERLAAACLLPSFPGVVAPEWALRWAERDGNHQQILEMMAAREH